IMSKKRSPAHGGDEPRTSRDAALAHLLDLIARLLARRYLRVQGREAKTKSQGRTRRGRAPRLNRGHDSSSDQLAGKPKDRCSLRPAFRKESPRMAAVLPSFPIADFPAEMVRAVVVDAARDAERVGLFLDQLGLGATPQKPLPMPAGLLLRLGAALR